MSNRAEILEKVKDIVASHLEIEKDTITEDSHFVKDLGADSLDTVELVMQLEEEFSVQIPDDVAEKTTTIGAAVDNVLANKKD